MAITVEVACKKKWLAGKSLSSRWIVGQLKCVTSFHTMKQKKKKKNMERECSVEEFGIERERRRRERAGPTGATESKKKTNRSAEARPDTSQS